MSNVPKRKKINTYIVYDDEEDVAGLVRARTIPEVWNKLAKAHGMPMKRLKDIFSLEKGGFY